MKQPVSLAPTRTADEGVDASGVVESGGGDRAALLAGEISRDEFLNRQVERALSPVQAVLAPERLARMRELLLLELAHDPVLSTLAARATAAS
jgi:pyridoxal/pyridoxine/pyridoxamine kinase